jgi:hypothetical protein
MTKLEERKRQSEAKCKNNVALCACPVCYGVAEAEFVDIEVGLQQVTPFYCPECGWSQNESDRGERN